jgi:hypothetical protein
VDQPGALGAFHAFVVEPALLLHALGNRQAAGFDRIDAFVGRKQQGLGFRQLRPHLVERGRIRLGDEIARPAMGEGAVEQLLSRLKCDFAGIALRDPVDQAGRQRLLRAERLAAGDHVERLADAGKARGALGAAGAGQDAEGDLRQADLCSRQRDSGMTGQGHFEPAAECRAVEDTDDRRAGPFQEIAQLRQPRVLRRLAELADIGTSDKGAALAVKRDRPDRGVLLQGFDGLPEPGADGMGGGIDRRVVDGDEADRPVQLNRDDGVDAGLRFRSHAYLPEPLLRAELRLDCQS